MTLTAKVRNHSIALPPDIDIAEGTEVRVIIEETAQRTPPEGKGRNSWMLKYAGAIKDLPQDFAAEHDHYIHGTPKKGGQ